MLVAGCVADLVMLHGARDKSETGLSSPVPEFLFSCVISWFPSSTFLIRVFEPWRWQLQATEGQSKLRLAGLHSRVGLPILDKPQRMSR